MLTPSIHTLMLVATLSLASHAGAQSGGMEDGDGVDPAVLQQALVSMNSAAGSKLEDALVHQALLQKYVKQAGLTEACGMPSSSDQHDMAMSFDQALSIAVDHERSSPTSSGPVMGATPAKVEAYTSLARSTWDRLQTAMGTVQHLTDCLNQQKKLDSYGTWETAQAKTHHEAMLAREKEVAKAGRAANAAGEKKVAAQYASWQEAQKEQHAAYLKHAWTAHKFNTNAGLKQYKYSKQYGPNSYNQTYAGERYGSGWGNYGGRSGYGTY